MRDEDFDQSYEGLMSLAASLGDVKPRATPDHVIAGLKTGFYKDWASEDCDKRCPICLDDYKALDPVLKLNDCSHWLHKTCLEQWLKGATTCPVCRKTVEVPAPPRHPRLRSHFHRVTTSPVISRDASHSRTFGHPASAASISSNTDIANLDTSDADNSTFNTQGNDTNNPTDASDGFRGVGFRRFHWEYQPPSH
jgi:hypothetical protein